MAKAPAEIRSLARKHTEEALDKLAFWMRSDNAKASVSAASYLLDRGWGKPKQALVGGDEDDAPLNVLHKIERVIVRPQDRNG